MKSLKSLVNIHNLVLIRVLQCCKHKSCSFFVCKVWPKVRVRVDDNLFSVYGAVVVFLQVMEPFALKNPYSM